MKIGIVDVGGGIRGIYAAAEKLGQRAQRYNESVRQSHSSCGTDVYRKMVEKQRFEKV